MRPGCKALFPIRASLVVTVLLTGCADPQVKPSEQHIKPAAKPAGAPPPLAVIPAVPPPKPTPRPETYSVVVNNVPARDVLFALARDAKIDIDISGDIEGSITLNALSQTLPQLLDRIARQIDMRWEMEGKVLQISRDTPFLRNYKVDYVNLTRQSASAINVATQITGSASAGGGGGAATTTSSTGNSSLTNVISRSNNDFWDSLINNLQDMLRETDKVVWDQVVGAQAAAGAQQTSNSGAKTSGTGAAQGIPIPNGISAGGSGNQSIQASANTQLSSERSEQKSTGKLREAASVIVNRETGIIAVRATGRQHEKIREFMDRVLNNARRQVLIEATIVEVTLNDQSQTGVDWKSVALASGFTFRQNLLGTALDKALPDAARSSLMSSIMGDSNLTAAQKSSLIEQIAPGGTVPLADTRFTGGVFPLTNQKAGLTIGYGKGSSFAGAISLLAQYGRTKVISSPKITALNNQAAVLRVVDNLVYFTINAQITPGAAGAAPVSVYTSTPHTVAVGFVMSVVPQIDDGNQVTLTVRPTISRLRGYAQDPNPVLRETPSLVPIVQTREMESVMKVPSGNVIMMGGLMEDSETRESEGFPTLGNLPGVGGLFSTRNNQAGKTELVVFLRPVVISDPGLEGDYSFAREMLPNKDFFNQPLHKSTASPTQPQPETTP